eukprot:CAMPEP_0181322126 /NCGR_PEP_ID=MMETSP1101-20121128/19061_1 /TAXON_ID=46948 /ORGANISM="Rhodomonas abbreviata, Strain Caron Lab Isolate" /LENGTH=580 /DNA_ID=CAMNT_0023430017 /DNA_START=175 /DNA_END=1918 /DNA_ORIENTATION=-
MQTATSSLAVNKPRGSDALCRPVNNRRKGEMRTKLTEEDVLEIYSYRWENKETSDSPLIGKCHVLAKTYKVSPKAVRDIWNMRTWTHVTKKGEGAPVSGNSNGEPLSSVAEASPTSNEEDKELSEEVSKGVDDPKFASSCVAAVVEDRGTSPFHWDLTHEECKASQEKRVMMEDKLGKCSHRASPMLSEADVIGEILRNQPGCTDPPPNMDFAAGLQAQLQHVSDPTPPPSLPRTGSRFSLQEMLGLYHLEPLKQGDTKLPPSQPSSLLFLQRADSRMSLSDMMFSQPNSSAGDFCLGKRLRSDDFSRSFPDFSRFPSAVSRMDSSRSLGGVELSPTAQSFGQLKRSRMDDEKPLSWDFASFPLQRQESSTSLPDIHGPATSSSTASVLNTPPETMSPRNQLHSQLSHLTPQLNSKSSAAGTGMPPLSGERALDSQAPLKPVLESLKHMNFDNKHGVPAGMGGGGVGVGFMGGLSVAPLPLSAASIAQMAANPSPFGAPQTLQAMAGLPRMEPQGFPPRMDAQSLAESNIRMLEALVNNIPGTSSAAPGPGTVTSGPGTVTSGPGSTTSGPSMLPVGGQP